MEGVTGVEELGGANYRVRFTEAQPVMNRLVEESAAKKREVPQQLDLFTDYEARAARQQQEAHARDRERRMQQAVLTIRKKYGKNAILRAMNLEEDATARDRNSQIGGHKA